MIADINQLIQSISATTNYRNSRVPFFVAEGNIYLCTENFYKTEALKKEYKHLCKRRLQFNELMILSRVYKLTYFDTYNLIEEIEATPPADIKKLLKFGPEQQAENIIDPYVELLAYQQQLLTEISSYESNSYSLKYIPSSPVQAALAETLETSEWSELDESALEVDTTGMKIDGRPNIDKFREKELLDFSLGKQISVATESLVILERIGLELDIALGQTAEEILMKSLETSLTKVFEFCYEQCLRNRIPLKEVQANFLGKYKPVKEIIVEEFIQESNLVLSQLKALDADPYDQIDTEIDTLKKTIELIPELDFFDWANPRIYELEFREPSDFESKTYQSFFSIDVFSLPEIFELDLPIATLAMIVSPSVYEDAALKVCGSGVNLAFNDEVLYKLGLNDVQRIEALIPQTIDEQELITTAEQNALKYLSED